MTFSIMKDTEFFAALDELNNASTKLTAAIARLSNMSDMSAASNPHGKDVPSQASALQNKLFKAVERTGTRANPKDEHEPKDNLTAEEADLPLRNDLELVSFGSEADEEEDPQEDRANEEKGSKGALWRAALSDQSKLPGQVNSSKRDSKVAMGKAMTVLRALNSFEKIRTTSGYVLHLRGMWKQGDQETIDGVAQEITVQVTSRAQGRQSITTQIDVTETTDYSDPASQCFVDHPARNRRLVWNAMCLALIIWDVLWIPMGVFGRFESIPILILDWFCAVYWTIDMMYNFRTGYFVGSQLEMKPGAIAYNYATSWLPLDLIIVTLEWAGRFTSVAAPASLVRSTRILRTLRFVKLVRLVKMRALWVHVAQQFTSNTFILLCQMTVLTIALMIVVHVMACSWYALGESRDDGWTGYVEYQGEKNVPFWYVASQRWVIAQLNGRTDLHDKRNMVERGFTVFVGVTMAVVAKAIFTSVITKTLLELSNVASDKNRRKRALNDYLDAHYLSTVLTTSVKHYAQEYRAKGADAEKEKMVLAILPPHIQNDLLVEVRSPRLLKHSLFLAMGTEAQRTMRRICVTALHLVSASTCEVLFCKGDPVDRMLFVDKGALTYGEPLVVDENEDFSNRIQWNSEMPLVPGGWVCEPALWVEWLTKGRLVSDHYSNLLELEAKTLHQVLKDDRHEYARTVLYAHKFVAELSREESDLSDIILFEVTAKREDAGRASVAVDVPQASKGRKAVFKQFSAKRNKLFG